MRLSALLAGAALAALALASPAFATDDSWTVKMADGTTVRTACGLDTTGTNVNASCLVGVDVTTKAKFTLGKESTLQSTLTSIQSMDTKLTSTNTKLDSVIAATDQLEGYVDGLEAPAGAPGSTVCATDTGPCDNIALIKRLNQHVTTLEGYVDQLEGYLDQVEAKLDTLHADVTSNTASPITIDQTTPGVTNGVRGDDTGAVGSAVPSRAGYAGANSGGNLTGLIQADASAKVSISTNTTTQIVALSSGKKIYVTNFNLHAAGTTTTKLVYGTGTNCGTGTTDLTDVYDFTAADGMVVGNGLGPVLVVPASNALCVANTAAIHVGGSIAYTQF